MNKTFITLAAWAAWACLPLQAAVEPAWDILDKDMTAWNADDGAETNRAWKTTKSYITAEQADGYVHLSKTGGADGQLVEQCIGYFQSGCGDNDTVKRGYLG